MDNEALHAMYVFRTFQPFTCAELAAAEESSRPPPPQGLVVRVDWRNLAASAYRARAIPGRVPLDAMGPVGLLNLVFAKQGVDKCKRRCIKVQAYRCQLLNAPFSRCS